MVWLWRDQLANSGAMSTNVSVINLVTPLEIQQGQKPNPTLNPGVKTQKHFVTPPNDHAQDLWDTLSGRSWDGIRLVSPHKYNKSKQVPDRTVL